MVESVILYLGGVAALAGAALVFKRRWRRRGAFLAIAGAAVVVTSLMLPAGERRVSKPLTRLDHFMPVWQFREVHSLRVAAPPQRVYEAVRSVTADEILLFRTLTWIRRVGRPLRPSILNPPGNESLIDVATRTTFIRLADEAPHELVVGSVILSPTGTRTPLNPTTYRQPLAPGHALATMNFLVRPDGKGGSVVSTETRVFANERAARRRFAVYWRIIYPGSSLIRRMWLRAIERRAAGP